MKKPAWVRSWLQRRVLHGQYEKLVAELREDVRGFRKYMRIYPELFTELVERVGAQTDEDGHIREESLGA